LQNGHDLWDLGQEIGPCQIWTDPVRRLRQIIRRIDMMRSIIGRQWLRLFGWTLSCPESLPRKFVFIAAPHTSTWDFPFMVATAWALKINISWFGKHTLFRAPFGWFFRAMGGIPVDRRSPQNLVQQAIQRFAVSDGLILGVPPEGTRRKVEHWKSGFYHIALGAEVPIGFGFLDFERRRCGVGGFIMPSGNVTADMDRVRSFYLDVRGRHPKLECTPRLREEADADLVVVDAQGRG
jgi:1-acyl-sn-glycerol-3-phosphate acyltransferase